MPICMNTYGERSDLHDKASSSGIAPIIGVFQAQDDVLPLLHLGPHHVFHLLGTVLKGAVPSARGCIDEACRRTQVIKSYIEVF